MQVKGVDSATCRVCSSQTKPWADSWLGFPWGKCTECCSVQKLIDREQFRALEPSYDPGFLPSVTPQYKGLEERMGVDDKYRLLCDLLGPNPQGSLLDIGCGMGGFLLAGKRLGLDVLGVEPSDTHSKAAVEIFGLNVVKGYYQSHHLDRQFDFIVLSHVIEHIHEPREFLVDVMKALKPGGRIILITPNCESLAARICRKYWSMYKPIDHVTMFSKKSIKAALPKGVVVERLDTSEWPGEFAAHILSAIKTAVRPAISGVGLEKPKGPTRKSTLGPLVRYGLAAMSLPFYIAGAILDRQSCLYAVVRNEVTSGSNPQSQSDLVS